MTRSGSTLSTARPAPIDPGRSLEDRLRWYAELVQHDLAAEGTPCRAWVRGEAVELSIGSGGAPAVPLTRSRGLSCGAAVHHLELAARLHGRSVRVDVAPRTAAGVFARVTEAGDEAPGPHDMAALAALGPSRLAPEPPGYDQLPLELPFRVQATALLQGATVRLVCTRRDRRLLAEGLGLAPDPEPPLGSEQDEPARQPLLAVLCTAADEPADWVVAGRAWSAVRLSAAMAGARARSLDTSADLPALSAALQVALRLRGTPQLVFALGG